MEYNYYCDGAATLNLINGEYQRQAGGWAWALIQEDKIVAEESGGLPMSTNNAMELTAISQALNHAHENTQGGDTINIMSDSAYCINIFTKYLNGWKMNGWTRGKKHEPIENLSLIKEIDKTINALGSNFIGVNWIKVKGHSDSQWNNYVDGLAVKAKKENSVFE